MGTMASELCKAIKREIVNHTRIYEEATAVDTKLYFAGIIDGLELALRLERVGEQ